MALLNASRNPFMWWRLAARRRGAGRAFGVAVLSFGAAAILGMVCVYMGDLVAQRPAFFMALPLVLAIGFAFVASPKMLVLAMMMLRAGLNSIFEQTQLSGMGGLGGAVNLAMIVLAFTLVVREPKRVPQLAWMIWLPFVALQLLGLTYAPDFLPAFRLFLGQFATMTVFIAAFYVVDDWASLDRIFKVIVASSGLVVLYTLAGIARGDAYTSLDGTGMSTRYAGPFGHPNILAFYLVLTMGVLLYVWKCARARAGWFAKGAMMFYMLLLLALLFATKTRSAWLSAVFLFFLYGLFVERRFLIYLALVPVLAMLVPEVRDRVLDLGQGNSVAQGARLNSFAWRKLIWTDALEWMKPSRYLFGYGNGSFLYFSTTFFSQAGGIPRGAHNVLVQQFFETGVAGLWAYLLMFWCSLRTVLRIRRADPLLAVIACGLIVSYLIISSSDNMLTYLVFNWYFWFMVGGVCSLACRLQTELPASSAASADLSHTPPERSELSARA